MGHRQHGHESESSHVSTPSSGPSAAPSGAGNAALGRLLRSAAPGGPPGGGPLDPSISSAIDQARGGGAALPETTQAELGQAFGTDLSSVRVHTGDEAHRLNQAVGAQAFTTGNDIFFSNGSYDPGSGAGRALLAHEVTHTVQPHAASGTPGTVSRDTDPAEVQARQAARLLSTGFDLAQPLPVNGSMARLAEVVHRTSGTVGQTDLTKLDEMLDRFNVPEGEAIALITSMSVPDKLIVATTPKYRPLIAAALDFGEMSQVVRVLPLTLPQKLEWLAAAAQMISAIGYDEIQPHVVAAPQAERDALKTAAWQGFFVDVCTNATMVTALNDLNYDLATKLTWLNAETTSTSAELDYATIQPWITAAAQGERDALKTPAWQSFFVNVCTNATMETAVQDLRFPLPDKLRWLMAEGTDYAAVKRVILAAADKALALSDQALLIQMAAEFSWDDFAKSVELLGRVIPGPGALLADPAVQAALASAWAASNPNLTAPPPAPPTPGVHEEGGFIYLNIITNVITTSRVPPGAQASLPLNDPAPPENAVTVGGFHTHPNVGPPWGAPFASTADTNWATRNGIPLLIRGAFPTVAATSDTSTGSARQHLAGDRGFPGAAGGTPPQAPLDGELEDEV
jgi:hypothetical protein